MGLTAIAACALLVLPQMAQAAPSEEEIAAAQAAEEAAKMSVAQIEVKLAEVNASAATAMQNAQIAGEDLNEATIALNEATATANQASADADAAEAAFQEGKQQIASVAQAAYRNGGGTLDALAPYLDSDGLRSVETKQAGISSFSTSAEVKMQNVAALEQVAKVTRDAANTALANQQAATDEVQKRTDAANQAATDAQNEAARVAAQRGAYVQELATKQNTTVELINQREAALEAERQEAARVAAELPRRVGVVLIDGHNPALAQAALTLGVPEVGGDDPFAQLEARPPHLRVLDGGSWKDWLPALLGFVDVAVVSEDFAPPLVARAGGEEVAGFLRGFGITRTVRTRGERPVQYWWDGTSGEVPVREVAHASTMGAGDAFHGAFAWALERAGDSDPERLIRFASAVAGVSVSSFGTRQWLASPDLAELVGGW